MTKTLDTTHIYHRTIDASARSSLTVVASLVAAGAKVLDLGTGSGSLGQFLSAQKACTVDGVTYNDDEAAVARPHYRRLEVANLETCDLQALFGTEKYDAIVCADVLEHIRNPERVVDACKGLLTDTGHLVISIPNAAYSGLVAELLGGEFKYREEGLLDSTHLRFFTRQSMFRLLDQCRWRVTTVEPVERDLNESEFKQAFDALPPAVSRYLLAVPDALTYQFVVSAAPFEQPNSAAVNGSGSSSGSSSGTISNDKNIANNAMAIADIARPGNANALFSAQLYLGIEGQYAEDRKLIQTGVIGKLRQTLRFDLPSTGPQLNCLRFDPADRPGFLHWYSTRLIGADGAVRWSWLSNEAGQQALSACRSHEMLVRPPWHAASDSTLVLLHGNDPWIELPLAEAMAAQPELLRGAHLEVDLGWPLSADYMALADLVNPLQGQVQDLSAKLQGQRDSYERLLHDEKTHSQHTLAAIQQETQRATRLAEQAAKEATQTHQSQWESTFEWARKQLDRAQTQAQTLGDKLLQLQHDKSALEVARASLQAEHHALIADKARLDREATGLQQTVDGLHTERQHCAQELAQQQEHNRGLLDDKQALIAANQVLMVEKDHALAQVTALQATLQQQQAQAEHALNHLRAESQAHIQRQYAEFAQLEQHLRWIENSTVFRVTRPVVKLKMWLQNLLQEIEPSRAEMATLTASNSALSVSPPASAVTTPRYTPPTRALHPVDVIVPVYKGLRDTTLCIESVLAAPCKTPFRLVVINDASPEPEVTAWLREAAQRDARMVLLENEVNLGFVGTVNRGMALSGDNDVVLVNSDAEVANDWLDRMWRAAYSDAKIASVTPFSNNATICSYPRFCQDNPLPHGLDTAAIDDLFAQANPGEVADVPTGVGFCMYIRRDSLNEIGLFDVANFGKGYGEENDFCCRAAGLGWRNLHLLDTFVHHSGGVSFGASKSAREIAAMETLRRLHPDYERDVHRFIPIDPAQHARRRVDLARIRNSRLPVVLAVSHNRGGGTQRHVQELAVHLADHALFLQLQPAAGGQLSLRFVNPNEAMDVRFDAATEFDALVTALKQLGVSHLHFHHLIGHDPQVMGLAQRLGVGYDVTAHDYYLFCPQISLTDHSNAYCGEKGVEQCRNCLQKSAAPGGLDIETWRAQHSTFLDHARTVFAPSADTARRFARVFPNLRVQVAPHTDMAAIGTVAVAQTARQLPAAAPLRIVVIGALSMIKGADVLEDVAAQAAKQGVLLDFHLLGYAYRDLRTRPNALLTVHGEYKDADLPARLAELQADIIWFPAQWPETYSYTLSAALQSGLPVIAPDIGAFAERVQARPWTWVQAWDTSTADWVKRFKGLREQHFATGAAPALPNVLSPTSTLTSAPTSAPTSRSNGANPVVWTYQRDYLTGVTRRTPLPVATTTTNTANTPNTAGATSPQLLSTQRAATEADVTRQFKHRLLLSIIRLRSAPGLRGVARAIPLRWQTRLKTWLQA